MIFSHTNLKQKFTKLLLYKYFNLGKDYLVPFGPNNQLGSIMISVPVLPLWSRLSNREKIKAILKSKWLPENEVVLQMAEEIIIRDIFGTKEDFGDILYKINLLNNHRVWNFDKLSLKDKEKIKALQGLRIASGIKHRDVTSDYLRLKLLSYEPLICTLTIPMIFHIPVISIRFYLELQENYIFNSIRLSGHPLADDIIDYLYETESIQIKVAMSFHNLIILIDEIKNSKKDSQLLLEEIDAMSICDGIVNYLKASIEKTMILLALIFEIKGLGDLRTHSQKLNKLEKGLPEKAKNQFYFEFLWQQIQSVRLEQLNNIRSGINHKKGNSKLQVHSFVGKTMEDGPFLVMFQDLMEQHRKNTLILLATLALMADDLMFRLPFDEDNQPFIDELYKIGKTVFEELKLKNEGLEII
ncbi:hypothetical protein [Pedobacter alpinus]|uniref:Apea-like HEPN domain-containing protein n=1 Tax=Pedobacter alpinus TaxID=1590643 RepID=A0ABW5TT75_9SPHI